MSISARYFAPAFKVEINNTRLASDVSKNITEISVDNEPGTLDHFSLTIANPYPEMRWTHSADAELFAEGNSIKIQMGYVDDVRPMFDGEITSISPTFPDGGMPTVRIEGYSRMHRLQGSQKTRTFRDVTDKRIAETIATELHLTPQAEDTQVTHPYVIQYNQTDFEFLTQRAARIRFEVVVEGKTLVFRKAEDDQSKTYTLVWGHAQKGFNPSQKVMPLRSFNPTLNTMGQVSRVIVRGLNPTTREKIEARAGTGDEDTKMGGTQTGPQVAARAFGSNNEVVVVDAPIATQREAEQLARSLYNDLALQFLTGSGASIGLPDLRAGRVIELDGLGKRFNGEYYITQATHSLGGGGYQTTFKVRRNSSG
jgi:phage protein D